MPCRDSVESFFKAVPPLPIMMALWLSLSTVTTTLMRSFVPSGRSLYSTTSACVTAMDLDNTCCCYQATCRAELLNGTVEL